jgi:hypothetical protein
MTMYRLYVNGYGERNWAVITPEDTFGPLIANEKSAGLELGYYNEAGKFLGAKRPTNSKTGDSKRKGVTIDIYMGTQ